MNPTPESSSNKPRIPTLKDVAREAGYHVTTVSNALRNHPSIPEKTRLMIQEIARRMGYERNPVFYALSRFRQEGNVRAPTPRIAFLENYGQGTGFTRPCYLQAIVDGARKQAALLGYDLETIAVGEDDHDTRSLTRHLNDNHIAGVIIGLFQPGFSEIALNWDELAVAKIHSRHTEPDATVVGNDQLRDVRLAFRHLTALGYRRIGLAVCRADEDACGHRHTAGYLMEEASLPPESRVPPLIFPYNLNENALGGMIGRWVKKHGLDVVLSNWNNVPGMLEKEGIKTPEQVAFSSLCICPPHQVGIAGVRPRLDLVGERAVSIVVTQLKAGDRGLPDFPSSIYVQSDWQEGPSAPRRFY